MRAEKLLAIIIYSIIDTVFISILSFFLFCRFWTQFAMYKNNAMFPRINDFVRRVEYASQHFLYFVLACICNFLLHLLFMVIVMPVIGVILPINTADAA